VSGDIPKAEQQQGSINEPGQSRQSLSPPSINEPPQAPDMPAPVITALSPESAAIGGEDFTLIITGEKFFAGSVIHFAGNDEPTTFDPGAKTLSTIVKPSLWATPVIVECTVYNGEVQSNAAEFEFTDAVVEGESNDKPRHHRGTATHTHASNRKR
jgi:hypothetical protein